MLASTFNFSFLFFFFGLNIFFFQEWVWKGFPGSPVFKTLWFQCIRPGLDPWLGNWHPHAVQHSKNNYQKKGRMRMKYIFTEGTILVWRVFFFFFFLKHIYSFIPLFYGFCCSDEKLVNCLTILPSNSFFSSGRFYYFLFASFSLKFHHDESRFWHTLTLWMVVFHQFQRLPSHICTDLASEIFPPFPPETPSPPVSAPLTSLASCLLCSFPGHLLSPIHSCAIRCLLGLKSSFILVFLRVLSVLFRFGTSCLIVLYSMQLFSRF